MRDAMSEVEEALSELRAVQEEYEEWKENIEEKFSGTPVYEKLDEVCNIGIEDISDTLSSAIDDAENAISEAEGVDLPRGFGRD
jgi:hypothetical protein